MKFLIAILLFLPPGSLRAQEITLFGRDGKAVAYISEDRERTIYLWNGTAVACLAPSGGDLDIWGLNGRHLGWLVRGTVYDGGGEAVGVTKAAATFFTEWEPHKEFKKAKPLPGLRRYAPYKPYWRTGWSDRPLAAFLADGLND
ncbi:MAG: hypothetical protein EOO11_05840 [Chitinophagaceae bacterium]|nr:MAG: hypothetical protein EOO11_05840 [Chitinophagaceae bacterium]